jgi:cystathionine beta-lyase
MRLQTRCVRSADPRDPYGATSPPIYQTSTFRQPSATEFGEYDYSRTANPTRTLFEEQIAGLESGRFGLAFASGMAALAALTRLVAAGDEILAGDDLYGGAARLLSRVAPRQGIGVRYVDTTDAGGVAAAIGPRTRLLLVETPTNPTLRIADVAALARACRARDVLLAVDNTLLSPVLQRPLELGADVVVHSATKSIGGHGDVIAGAIVTDREDLRDALAFHQNAEGSGLAPFDSWLLLRGLKTLALRVERQCATATRVAGLLATHPAVERVFYPALAVERSRAVHERQARGFGPVVSFATGDPERSRRIVESLALFTIAVSFGAVGSSVSLPCRMSHASIPTELRSRLAPPADLVRLSLGIEDPDDLLDDLARALAVGSCGSEAPLDAPAHLLEADARGHESDRLPRP